MKILTNIIWAILGKFFQVIRGVVISILLARYLGPSQFGLMQYVISFVTLFSILASFGLDNVVVRNLSSKDSNKDEILGSSFLLRFSTSLLSIMLICITALWSENNPLTYKLIILYSSFYLFDTFSVIRNYFISKQNNKIIAVVDGIRVVLSVIVILGLIYFEKTIDYFIIGQVFEFVILSIGLVYFYWRTNGSILNWKWSKGRVKSLVKSSYPLALSGMALILYQKIDMIMIGKMMSDKDVGHFSVAAQIVLVLVFVPIIIGQSLIPNLISAKEKDEKQYTLKRQLFSDYLFWTSFFMTVMLMLSSGFLISFLYDKAYLAAIPVLIVLSLKGIFSAMGSATGSIMIIDNTHSFVMFRNVLGLITNVLLNYIMIPKWGIVGSAWATVISYSIATFFAHLFIPPFRYLFKIQVNSIITGLYRISFIILKKIK